VGWCKDTQMCFEQHLRVRLYVHAYVCVRVCGCVGVGVGVGVGVSVGVDVAMCMCVYTHIQKRGATPGLLALCNCLFLCRSLLRIYRALF